MERLSGMTIKRWLAGGALLALAMVPAAGVLPPTDGDPGASVAHVRADGGIVANDLGPDNTQAKH